MIEKRDLAYWKAKIDKYEKNVIFTMSNELNRSEMSESLMNGLRHFSEAVMCYVHKASNPEEYQKRYQEIKKSQSYCKSIEGLNFIADFHEMLNGSVGHEDVFGDYAERLFLKYYRYLIRIKDLLLKQYEIDILKDLSKYPLDLDESFVSYYRLIIKTLSRDDLVDDVSGCDSYYIQKKKMLFVDGVVFYEYTMTNAIDGNSKFDRFIVFSLLDIPENYAIKARITDKSIKFFNQNIDYHVAISFKVAIRPCELEKLSKIMGHEYKFGRTKDYWLLMDYLSHSGRSLNKIVELPLKQFSALMNDIFKTEKVTPLMFLLEKCRSYIKKKGVGSNTLRYLLYKPNNQIIKYQMSRNEDDSLNCIGLNKGTYGFDKNPFSIHPLKHVPQTKDLISVFGYLGHEPELIAKAVENASLDSSCIYVSREQFISEKLDAYIEDYNSAFWKPSLENRKIMRSGEYLYLNENEINTRNILTKIISMAETESFPEYSVVIDSLIDENNISFDDDCKKQALKRAFDKTSVFVVYGPAGSGKSYFANYVLKVMSGIKKVCIASTNPAVDNMRRKFKDNTADYMTITKYLSDYTLLDNVGLLVIDECSAVSSKDMCDILAKTNPSLMLLLGDTYQIKPVAFGNWFSLLRKFLKKEKYVDLNNQYRSESKILLNFWGEVRNVSKNIQELLNENQISHHFEDSIFKKLDEDEVILCLNYDGLYGINNLNRVLQKNNPNKEYKWKQYIFKVDDPIIFLDNSNYKSVLYNNLKGTIKAIEENNDSFEFTVKINKAVNAIACKAANIKYIKSEEGGTIISFKVQKFGEDSYDIDSQSSMHIPFQIAYALSIHKAQGLEYNSVKIIISNEVEENITHSVFYTAITRAKKQLNIYWTPESETKIINNFYVENCNNDATILASKYPELELQK